ncbi:MAG: response regulator [Verrucomicrobiota bacterium]
MTFPLEDSQKWKQLARVAETAKYAIVVTDTAGNITWCNYAFTALTGYTLEEILGKKPGNFLQGPKTDPETVERMRKAIEDHKDFEGEIYNYTHGGKGYWVLLSISPLCDEQGHHEGFVSIQVDITERKYMESEMRSLKESLEIANEQLEQANTQLEEALSQANQMATESSVVNQIKDEFIMHMTHEIRTSLASVIGLGALLEETTLSPEQKEYADGICVGGDTILTIIQDVLDFSRIEKGDLQIVKKPFDIRHCVEMAVECLASKASEKRLDLACWVDDSVPQMMVGDAMRIRQILLNFLTNAVKFTEEGEVVVTVESQHREGSFHEIRFKIQDTGIGIPKDRMSVLFQPFGRVEQRPEHEGTGLGLCLSRRLANLMGGTASARSEEGKGSTFYFSIVIEAKTASPPVYLSGEVTELKNKKVWIAGGSSANARFLAQMLEIWGISTHVESSLEQVVQQISQRASIPDGVILSTLSGYSIEWLEKIRKSCEKENIPLATLLNSGEAVPFPIKTISKPLRREHVYQTIMALFTSNSLATSSAFADKMLLADDLPLRVLLVEDNAINRKVATRMFEKQGYRIDSTANGLQAVEAQHQHQYDVIMMDLRLPGIDGIEATRRIRKTCAKQPWIIALTASVSTVDREECMNAGMNDFIAKPLRFEDISSSFEKILSKKIV